MENAFATRLISARKMAGLSLQGLADRLGNVVTKQSLNKYEQGKMKPDSKLLNDLADALNVSVDYFLSSPTMNIEFSEMDFRKYNSKLSKNQEESLVERAKDALERYFEIENILNLNEPNEYFEYGEIVSAPEDAEKAAKELRKKWDLGYDPITDVVEMLEDKGYRVVEIDADEGFDGMKANVSSRKVIALKKTNALDDVVRKRFTALHELAHHSLRFPEDISQTEEEKLCHAFASAILYPEEMARKELNKERFHFYTNELVLIKERWGISISAIFSRAKQLGIINDYIFKKFTIGYRKRGWHELNVEPGRFMSKEKPTRSERLIYLALSKELISVNEAAYYAGKSVWKFREQIQPIL